MASNWKKPLTFYKKLMFEKYKRAFLQVYDLQQTAILYSSTSNIVGNVSNEVLTSMNIKSFMNLYLERKNIQAHWALKTELTCVARRCLI